MAELRKFKETKPLDTPTQNSKENPDKIKNGNETGVGTDFTQKYNEVLDRIQKEKFPNYIDPSTMDVINNPGLMGKFQKMSQMKESLLKAVDEELKNPKVLELESEPESESESILEFFDKKTNVGKITPEELKQAEVDAHDPKFWEKIPEKKLTKKEINKLPEEEKKKIIDSMTTDELWAADYRFGDPELENAINKKVGLDPNKIKTSDKKNPVPITQEKENPAEEVLDNVPETPVFTQEDQLLSEKLEKEIYDLKEEILNLEKQRAELENIPEPKTEVQNETTNEEKEGVPASAPERKEIITEYVEIEDYKKAIDKIVINKLGDAFEKNGLDYEDTLVEYNNGKVHTEIKFNYGKVTLAFDLVSQEGRAILTNDEWKQGGWNKFVTLNKLNKKNAEQWSNIIINEFAKTKSKDNKPMKIDIKDGMLEVQHQI